MPCTRNFQNAEDVSDISFISYVTLIVKQFSFVALAIDTMEYGGKRNE